jgi:1-acyl-sn-glycerol-3-phosphate acyltransferase
VTADVPAASRTYRLAAGTAFGVMALQRWRFDVAGAEHLPTSGGAVIAANHTSFWDFFVVGHTAYYGIGRPVRILAKASLFRTPVFGRLMTAAGHIPVERTAGGGAFGAAVRALQDGEVVLVLPEQTISPAFELLPFKSGAARMAGLAGVPLIPAASWGSHRFHTVQRRPRPRWRLPVSVGYGQPLHPTADDDPREVTAHLRRSVAGLHDDLVAGYADGAPQGAWWVPARFGGGAPDPADALGYLDHVRRNFFRRAS